MWVFDACMPLTPNVQSMPRMLAVSVFCLDCLCSGDCKRLFSGSLQRDYVEVLCLATTTCKEASHGHIAVGERQATQLCNLCPSADSPLV
jgi:hypothetical protein